MVNLSLCMTHFPISDSPVIRVIYTSYKGNFTSFVVVAAVLCVLLHYSYLNCIHNKVTG